MWNFQPVSIPPAAISGVWTLQGCCNIPPTSSREESYQDNKKAADSKSCLALQPAWKERGCTAVTTEQGEFMKTIFITVATELLWLFKVRN